MVSDLLSVLFVLILASEKQSKTDAKCNFIFFIEAKENQVTKEVISVMFVKKKQFFKFQIM